MLNSAIEGPDRKIEQRRERDPSRQWDEAVRGQSIQPVEHHNSRDDQGKLRDDVDQAEKRAVGGKEHPRPCSVHCQLDQEQYQR